MFTQQIQEEEPEDSDSSDDEGKRSRTVYIIVYQSGNHIRDKLQKICDSFSGSRYDIPDLRNISSDIENTKREIEDTISLQKNTRKMLRNSLVDFDKGPGSEVSTIFIYKMFLAQEKALYQNLNCMKSQNN